MNENTWHRPTFRGAYDLRSAPVPAMAEIDEPYLKLSTLTTQAAIHGVLGLIMFNVPAVATLHALGCLLLGLILVADPKRSHRAIYVCGYISTADVLWRMTKAQILWEYGKYAVTLLALMMLWRQRGKGGLAPLAMIYLALLLPSAILTIDFLGLSNRLRQELSFNLSGPLALTASVMLCSSLSRRLPDLARLLTWMVMPIVGILSISLYSTLTTSGISFRNQANFAASGGYGPNQVSAALGLGAFLSLLMALNVTSRPLRWALLGLAAAFQLQTFLTFSRGGTFNVVIAVALLSVHLIRQQRARRVLLPILVGGTILTIFLLLPRLNAWTAGGFSERYTNIDSTGRRGLAEADLRLFEDNPVLGVGPGLSKYRRTDIDRIGIASHTEFTRLVAEHGIFGLAALAVLLWIALRAYRLAPSVLAKGWVISLAAWSLAEMSHSAMRIACISFVFGLATLALHRAAPPEPSDPERALPEGWDPERRDPEPRGPEHRGPHLPHRRALP